AEPVVTLGEDEVGVLDAGDRAEVGADRDLPILVLDVGDGQSRARVTQRTATISGREDEFLIHLEVEGVGDVVELDDRSGEVGAALDAADGGSGGTVELLRDALASA